MAFERKIATFSIAIYVFITVLQKLVDREVSTASTQVSRCAEKPDVGLQAWRVLGVSVVLSDAEVHWRIYRQPDCARLTWRQVHRQ